MQKTWEMWVRYLGQGDSLEKEMATHSSILAWKTPWTESLAGYYPWSHKELDKTYQLNNNNEITREIFMSLIVKKKIKNIFQVTQII